MQNNEEKQDKPILKSSIITQDSLYEMVYDNILSKTSYFRVDRSGAFVGFIEEAEIEGKKYKPLPPDHPLIDKRIVYFPSQATPYESEEEILSEIRTFIHKYLDISEEFEQIAVHYVLFTWIYDRFNEVPYLRALGDYGSGKSRFLQTIGLLCYKPTFTGGATTPSPIFRIISDIKGTLVMDEADFKLSDMTSDMIKILNMGYQKGGSALRMGGKTMEELKAFDVYCPKIIATRETFSDKALESRFLVEEMGTDKLRTDIPRTLEDSFYSEAELIRNKLLMWRLNNYFLPIEKRNEVMEDIHPRLNQIVIPLLSIIKDEVIRTNLKTFIIRYNSELVADRGLSWESDIILAILKLEYETKAIEITVKQITDEVNREIDIDDDSLQPRKVGWYLRKKLQLKPYKTRKGFVLSFKENRKKLDVCKERYGITDADIRGEHVNDVKVVNDVESMEQITEQLGFN